MLQLGYLATHRHQRRHETVKGGVRHHCERWAREICPAYLLNGRRKEIKTSYLFSGQRRKIVATFQ